MPVLSKPSSAARTALVYITLGALTVIWTLVYYWWRKDHPPEGGGDAYKYVSLGFLVTGLTLFVIGLAVGQIGRAARHAELPPPEVTGVEARVEQAAASRAPMIAPVNPAAAAIAPNGQGVIASAPLSGAGPAQTAPVVPGTPPLIEPAGRR